MHSDFVGLSGLECCRDNDRKISVLIFALLNKIQIFALLILYPTNTECAIETQWQDSGSGDEGAESNNVGSGDRTLD